MGSVIAASGTVASVVATPVMMFGRCPPESRPPVSPLVVSPLVVSWPAGVGSGGSQVSVRCTL